MGWGLLGLLLIVVVKNGGAFPKFPYLLSTSKFFQNRLRQIDMLVIHFFGRDAQSHSKKLQTNMPEFLVGRSPWKTFRLKQTHLKG